MNNIHSWWQYPTYSQNYTQCKQMWLKRIWFCMTLNQTDLEVYTSFLGLLIFFPPEVSLIAGLTALRLSVKFVHVRLDWLRLCFVWVSTLTLDLRPAGVWRNGQYLWAICLPAQISFFSFVDTRVLFTLTITETGLFSVLQFDLFINLLLIFTLAVYL